MSWLDDGSTSSRIDLNTVAANYISRSNVHIVIPAPPLGWTQRFSAHLILYEAPDRQSRIRCFQHLPLEPVSRTVARISRGEVATLAKVVSAEGEYGALCTTTAERVVGVLFADTSALAIEAAAEHADRVRELLERWQLELGMRPRRFVYQPPRGWLPMPNALTTTWFPPGFPDDHTELVVYAATPAAPHDELAQLLALERVNVVGEIHEHPVEMPNRLAGTHATFSFEASGSVVHRELVLLWRSPYRYALKLEYIGELRHQDVLLEVARSVEPLPVIARDAAGAAGHWTD
jgi:hypothetical protein